MLKARLGGLLLCSMTIFTTPLTATTGEQSKLNISRPVKEFASPTVADFQEIESLAAQFFITMQSEGAVGIISYLPSNVQGLDGLNALFGQVDATCPEFDALSAGEVKIFSADVVEKSVFTLSDNCMLRWRLTFARRPEGWKIYSVQIDTVTVWR